MGEAATARALSALWINTGIQSPGLSIRRLCSRRYSQKIPNKPPCSCSGVGLLVFLFFFSFSSLWLLTPKFPRELRSSPHLILLLVLQDGLKERPALVAGGFLVEHSGLDHLLVHVELVLGGRQDLLLHAVDGAEPEHADLVLLPDAVGPVLGLQVLEEGAVIAPGSQKSHFRPQNPQGEMWDEA